MTLKFYLIVMSIVSAICWGSFLFIAAIVDPQSTNYLGFFLFYFSLFLSLVGAASIIGFLIRFIVLKHELIFRSVQTAFRQSFLFAFLVIAVLFLLAHHLFTWLNLFLLILALSILEFFLISYKKL